MLTTKIAAAVAAGARRIYIPLQNERDITLAVRKSTEGRATIRPVRSVETVCRDLFEKPTDPSLAAIAGEAAKRFYSFFVPGSTSFAPEQRHAWHSLLSSTLFAAVFALEGLGCYMIYNRRSVGVATAILVMASLGVFAGTLACYSVPRPLMERGNNRAWWLSMAILGLVTAAAGMLYSLLVPTQALNTGPIYDWPPLLVLFKDLTVFWLFGIVYMTNIYCFVVALEYLAEKRQFHTIRRSIEGDDEAIASVPTTVIHMPFKWAVVMAAAIAGFLLVFEMNYFGQLDERIPETTWIIVLGLVRDAVFIILAFEVLSWYRISLADIKRKLRSPG